MLSSSGSASIAPMPRSIVRRGIARFEMIIARSSSPLSLGLGTSCSPRGTLNGVLFTTPRITDDHR